MRVCTRPQTSTTQPAKLSIRAQPPASQPQNVRDDPVVLPCAVLDNDVSLLELLLAARATVDKPCGLPHSLALTPLQLAAALGHGSCARKLLEAGADPRARVAVQRVVSQPGSSSPPPLPAPLEARDLSWTRAGDTALHIAVDCDSRAQQTDVLEVRPSAALPRHACCVRRPHRAA
jgi:hypothetical protein